MIPDAEAHDRQFAGIIMRYRQNRWRWSGGGE